MKKVQKKIQKKAKPASQSKSMRTHVVKRESGWAVKKEGNIRASKVCKTKDEAVNFAKNAKKSNSDLVIHKKDGSIEKWVKSKKGAK